MKRLLAIVLLGASLAGCAQFQKIAQVLDPQAASVINGGVSVLSPVQVSINQEYSLEAIYNAGNRLYLQYLKLPRCAPGSSTSLDNLCRDPEAVVTLAKVRREIVIPAVQKARQARDSGDVNAASLAQAAMQALMNWQSSIPMKAVQ